MFQRIYQPNIIQYANNNHYIIDGQNIKEYVQFHLFKNRAFHNYSLIIWQFKLWIIFL